MCASQQGPREPRRRYGPPGSHPRHGHPFLTRRRFFTKEEVIAQLEEYLKRLQAEAKGVEERIAELKKEQT